MLAMAIPQQALTSVQKETAASAGDSSKQDRKSTRLNSSHGYISYAVFCLKKKHAHRERRGGSDHEHRPPLRRGDGPAHEARERRAESARADQRPDREPTSVPEPTRRALHS